MTTKSSIKMVKVHLYDTAGKEIKTQNFDKIFRVYEKNGKLGIDWNTEKKPYCCNGEIFIPLEDFAPTVIFEDVDNDEMIPLFGKMSGGMKP